MRDRGDPEADTQDNNGTQGADNPATSAQMQSHLTVLDSLDDLMDVSSQRQVVDNPVASSVASPTTSPGPSTTTPGPRASAGPPERRQHPLPRQHPERRRRPQQLQHLRQAQHLRPPTLLRTASANAPRRKQRLCWCSTRLQKCKRFLQMPR